MPYAVRKADLVDLPALIPLVVASHRTFPPVRSYTRTLRLLGDMLVIGAPQTVVLLVENPEHGAVGFAWCEVLEEGDLFIHHLYSRGGGRELAEAIRQVALKSGCRRVSTLTARDIQFARAVERRFGMKITGYLLSKSLEVS